MRRNFFYHKAIVAGEAAFSPPESANLVSQWTMDIDSYHTGNYTFTDTQQSGILYNTKYDGVTTWSAFGFSKTSVDTSYFVDDHRGRSQKAFDTKGIMSPRNVASYSALVPTGATARTICWWQSTTDTETNGWVAYGAASTRRMYSLGYEGQLRGQWYGDAANYGWTIPGASWVWVCHTYDGTTARAYINNVEKGTGDSVTLNTGNGTYNLSLANHGISTSVVDMSMCNVMVYNVVLSSASRADIYANQ